MYTYEYNSSINNGLKKDFTLKIFLDEKVIETRIVQFNNDVTQEELHNYAHSVIQYLEGLEE